MCDFRRVQGFEGPSERLMSGSKGLGLRPHKQGSKDSGEMLKNYKELNVWQKSYDLCLKIYKITAKFPKEERYGLTSQIRRAVVSIPSNIAEGYGRKTTADYLRMLYIPMVQFVNWKHRYYWHGI